GCRRHDNGRRSGLGGRPGHGSPDPNSPTQPARKKPDPTRPELRGGWARAVFFDPQQSTGRARAVIFDPKPDPTRKTRPKGQKTRPNPKKTRPDTPAQGPGTEQTGRTERSLNEFSIQYQI